MRTRDDMDDAPAEPPATYRERVYTARTNQAALLLLRVATAVVFVGMAPAVVVMAVYGSPLLAVAGLFGLPVLLVILHRAHRSVLERSDVEIEDRLVGWPKRDAVEIIGHTEEGLPLYSTKIPRWQYRAFMVAGFLMAIGTLLLFSLAYEGS